MTTPADLISTARYTINDTTAAYRNSDAELLSYFNAGVLEISMLDPALFVSIGDLPCSAGDVEQAVTFSDAQAIFDVLCIHGGAAVRKVDMASLDSFRPGWRTDAAGAATNWMTKPNDRLRFFIYPPAPASQTLDVMYVRIPATLGLTDTIAEVPAYCYPALIDYIVFRAESKDDEHVNSNRASGHYQSFVAKIKAAVPASS